MKFTFVLKGACILFITVLMISCSSSRFQDGFNYKPAYAGPDMGSDRSTDPALPATSQTIAKTAAENERTVMAPTNVEPAAAPALNSENPGLRADNDQALLLMEVAERTARESSQPDQTSFRAGVRKMAGLYAEKTNTVYSEKQLKKLDKIASRFEKKQQRKGPDVQWGPANNLEWAILGAAAVGLFVGIFGIGFGWFIFLIAALAYLYFKLIHNN